MWVFGLKGLISVPMVALTGFSCGGRNFLLIINLKYCMKNIQFIKLEKDNYHTFSLDCS